MKRQTEAEKTHASITLAKRVRDLCFARPKHFNWRASRAFNALKKRVGFTEAMAMCYKEWFR